MAEPRRIQRRRQKGWRKPPNAVIVDRTSRYGNPFVVGVDADDNAHAVALFKQWLTYDDAAVYDPYGTAEYRQSMADRRDRILGDLHLLVGKDLACFCGPEEPCHADVLLEAAAELYGNHP